jgi:BASS family bile acid:Na+ symporter
MKSAFPDVASGVLTGVYLTVMMFWVGLGLRAAPRPTGTKRAPLGPQLLGALLALVIIPALAVVLTRSLRLTSDVAFALLIVAACPGGRFAPDLTRKAAGDVSLASTQIFLLTKLAPFTAPLTTKWLLGLHQLHVASLPMILRGLLLQTLPLYAGKTLARRRAHTASRLERPLSSAVAVATFAVLAVLVWRSGLASLEILGDRGWLAVACVVAGSLALGWLFGGAGVGSRRALVATALSRNVALALLLAGLAFPERHHVQLAVFGIWWILLGAGYTFALIARRTSN